LASRIDPGVPSSQRAQPLISGVDRIAGGRDELVAAGAGGGLSACDVWPLAALVLVEGPREVFGVLAQRLGQKPGAA
jgi:hypothetical protein